MSAADNLPAMCGILPVRPLMILVALLWLLTGFTHMCFVGGEMIGDLSPGDFGEAPSCQGSSCHAEWRTSIFSCEGGREATFRLKYLSVGILGMLFGYLGLLGTFSGNMHALKAYGYFFIGMIVLHIGVLIADQGYALDCGVLSLNMQRDIEKFVPARKMSILRAQGYRDLSGMKLTKIRSILGYDYNTLYVLLWTGVFMVGCYFVYLIFKLARAMEDGPCHLGPNRHINFAANREAELMADRIQAVVQDHLAAPRYHRAFENLEDANKFPYVSAHKGWLGDGASPSISYGTLGSDKRRDQE